MSAHKKFSLGSGDTGGFEFRYYLEVIRRRKALVMLTALGIFLCTVVVAHGLPNVYRSQTVILVDAQQVPSTYVTSTVSTSIQDRLVTIQQQVLSPTHLKMLIDKLGLYPELRGKVSDDSLVQRMIGSTKVDVPVNQNGARLSSFSISFESENPAEASQVANALAATFIEENLKAREEQFEGTADFLDGELQDTKKSLDAKEQQLDAIKSTYVMDLPESQQFHMEALNNLRMQMTASQDRVNRAQQDKMVIQSMMSSSAPTMDMDGEGAGAMSGSQVAIEKAQAHLADLQSRYGPSFPDVRKAQADLDRLKKAAAQEAKQAPAAIVDTTPGAGTKNPVLEAQLVKLNQEIEDQTKQQADTQQQINFHVSKLARVPIFQQQMAGLMRDDDALRAHYQDLLDKKLAAQMASQLEARQKGERFVVLDPAPVPAQPYGPNRPLINLAGLLGGLLGGLALAVMVDRSDESVRNESQAVQLLGMPVLVGIPQMYTAAELRARRMLFIGAAALTAVCSTVLGFVISHIAGKIGL